LHNVFYAGFAIVAGWLADRFPKNIVLAAGYAQVIQTVRTR
jgi:hypothetical protein